MTDDVSLEVATAGPPDAPVLLFLHGNGPNARQFAPQFATFADDYRLIAPSFRGHGRSDMPPTPTVDDFTIPRLTKDVLAVLDRLEVDQVHLVGNSLGGIIGFQLLATAPQRLTSLITFGTTAQLRSSAALVWTVRATLRLLGTTGASRLAALTATDRAAGRTIAALMAEADRHGVALIAENIATYDYTPTLRASTVPWLLLRGERDRGINRTLDSTLAVIEARDDATVIDIDGAGHFANLEQPAAFDAAVAGFVARRVHVDGAVGPQPA